MKQVISYSLYGENKLFIAGAFKNVALAQQIYPDHIVWFYVADDVPEWVTSSLRLFPNVEIIDAPQNY